MTEVIMPSQNLPESLSFLGRYVQLVPLADSHIADLLSASGLEKDPVFALTWVPNTFESMQKYIQSAQQESDNRKSIPFAILDQRSQKVIGSTRFGNLEFWTWQQSNHPLKRDPSIPDALEIGWTWLAKSAQRSGINTEMKLLMLTHAFEVWKVHRVQFRVDSRNSQSRGALERFGIRLDGILRANMPGYDGAIRDTAYYSILYSEWESTKRIIQSKLI